MVFFYISSSYNPSLHRRRSVRTLHFPIECWLHCCIYIPSNRTMASSEKTITIFFECFICPILVDSSRIIFVRWPILKAFYFRLLQIKLLTKGVKYFEWKWRTYFYSVGISDKVFSPSSPPRVNIKLSSCLVRVSKPFFSFSNKILQYRKRKFASWAILKSLIGMFYLVFFYYIERQIFYLYSIMNVMILKK